MMRIIGLRLSLTHLPFAKATTAKPKMSKDYVSPTHLKSSISLPSKKYEMAFSSNNT
ncbi:hypothetical protein SAMN05421640_1037 [Ekhidna lutea]|uniref:Uncharacterized protein n=1 Tax=Ekhidna lutea TaxID=447679 RepID=A0A239GWD0_EKHLU|nr:hypothetical protein SAMN05421640_1037 [Ekhidna lutea]